MDEFELETRLPASNLALAALRMGAGLDAEEMAAALSAPAAIRQMGLDDFYMLLAQGGVDVEALDVLWSMDSFVNRVEAALASGSAKGLGTLIMSVAHRVPAGAITVIQGVVASITLRTVDVAWAEIAGPRQVAPVTVTAADVTAELAAAGYVWSDGQWQYTGG